MTSALQQYDWARLDDECADGGADPARRARQPENRQRRSADIIAAVREEGDAALARYTAQFDGVVVEYLRVTDREIGLAEKLISDEREEGSCRSRSITCRSSSRH